MGKDGEAKSFFDPLCKSNNSESCFELGNIESKLGNNTEASKAFSSACDGGSPKGCVKVFTTAIMKNPQQIKSALQYLIKARTLFNKSCATGSQDSCESLKQIALISAKFGIPNE